tara:strand:+ start:5540 stop:7117 length:1578 start_codon:yes stop_codon:yes gene_type:complete
MESADSVKIPVLNMDNSKWVAFDDALGFFAELKRAGDTIVQCHGTFDLLHPGHVIHLEEASSFGDRLVVTLTAEEHVNKGPGRPYFNDELRVKFLSSLQCVDYVVVIPFPAAVEAIEAVQPNYYCKGKEYSDSENDATGNIDDDIAAVARVGGDIRFIGSVVFSSTRLLNNFYQTSSPEVKLFCQELSKSCSPDRFRELVEAFSELKVLVIGDIIFDRYTTVNVQGLTSKGKVVSTRMIEEETQPGGALAVFRHIREFTEHVKLLSIVGKEPWLEEALTEYVPPENDEILRLPDFTTIVKQRFIEPQALGKEINKLFSVNHIDSQHPNGMTQKMICERLQRQIKNFDLVLVMDFGHGVMQAMVREMVQEHAPFMALNCQTNSNNYGFNLINNKYRRADSFTVDTAEMMLAAGNKSCVIEDELKTLRTHLGAEYGWLTRGGDKTVGINDNDESCGLDALEQTVIDTVGAGDAFCALASMGAASGLSLEMSTFMGQLGGSLAVGIVGNREPIEKSKILKGGMSLLTY